MRRLSTALVVVGLFGLTSPTRAAEPRQQSVAAHLGKAGTEMPGGVYRVGLPRSDLKVMLEGVQLKPAFALGSWLAFSPKPAGPAR